LGLTDGSVGAKETGLRLLHYGLDLIDRLARHEIPMVFFRLISIDRVHEDA
jgi:hypothetical protein